MSRGAVVIDPFGVVVRACLDPGAFVERLGREPLWWWQARSVLAALELAGHKIDVSPGAHAVDRRAAA